MPVIFQCEKCELKLSVASRKIGTRFDCPNCAWGSVVPAKSVASQRVVIAEDDDNSDEHDEADQRSENVEAPNISAKLRGFWRNPVKLTLGVAAIFGISLFIAFLTFMIFIARDFSPMLLFAVSFVFFAIATVFGYATLQILTAKQRAIAGQPVSLLFGLARLVTWEQNEGVIFMRDKRISEKVHGPRDGGGLRIIYPVMGEELRVRAPFTIQLTEFKDKRVSTRESVQLTIKVAIRWSIEDLEKCFFRIDKEIHSLKDTDRPADGYGTSLGNTKNACLRIAEIWVQKDVESCLRRLISETSTLLIISEKASSALPNEMGHYHDVESKGIMPTNLATPNLIAEQLQEQLAERVETYGLVIERIEVQEVQLPPAIQKAVDDIWIAATMPKKSQFEAEAMKNRMEVAKDVLGKESAAMMEIMQRMPTGGFMGNPLAALQSLIGQMAAEPVAPRATSAVATKTPVAPPPAKMP